MNARIYTTFIAISAALISVSEIVLSNFGAQQPQPKTTVKNNKKEK